MDKHELLARTKSFALRSLKLVDHLPRALSGRTIGNQLVGSATSVGANYRAACRSRSRGSSQRSLESLRKRPMKAVYWLELIHEAKLMPDVRISSLLDEANELFFE
jgi:four helix bundle protein